MATPTPENLADPTVDRDLANALFPILSASKHAVSIMSKLPSVTRGPYEADWRTPLDLLSNHVWFFEDVPHVTHW